MAYYQPQYDQPQYPMRAFRASATSRTSLTDVDLTNERQESFYSREEMIQHAKEVKLEIYF
jgi:hypothetical protein